MSRIMNYLAGALVVAILSGSGLYVLKRDSEEARKATPASDSSTDSAAPEADTPVTPVPEEETAPAETLPHSPPDAAPDQTPDAPAATEDSGAQDMELEEPEPIELGPETAPSTDESASDDMPIIDEDDAAADESDDLPGDSVEEATEPADASDDDGETPDDGSPE